MYLLFEIMYFFKNYEIMSLKYKFSPEDLAGTGTIGLCFIVTKLLGISLLTSELFDISFLVIDAIGGIFFFVIKPD